MDNKISISDVEKLMASRSTYDPSDDCPFTEEIAMAAAAGNTFEEISARFPHIGDCALCRESIELFAAIDDARYSNNTDNAEAPKSMVTIPLPPPARRKKILFLAIAAILLAGIAGGIGITIWQALQRQTTKPTLTPKGAVFDVEIAVRRNGTGFPLEHGEMVETGDNMGFFYSATQNAHLALFHLDEKRELSPLFPIGETRTPMIEKGTRVPIKDGALVTPASSCEWIVAVFSQKPMSVVRLESHLTKSIHISKKSGACDIRVEKIKDVTVKIQQIRNGGT